MREESGRGCHQSGAEPRGDESESGFREEEEEEEEEGEEVEEARDHHLDPHISHKRLAARL